MKIDITVVFENGKELQITDADKYMLANDGRDLKITKNDKAIFINFGKILYVGVTQDLN